MSLEENLGTKARHSYPQPYEAQRVAENGPLLLQDFHLVRIRTSAVDLFYL